MNQPSPLYHPALKVPGVRHGFFTRQGGVSHGIYASLNCGWGAKDDSPECVGRNRALALQALEGSRLATPYQVHGTAAVRVDKAWGRGEAPRADALVTNRPGLAVGVLSADCVPVLLADRAGQAVGAAHAGWRGAVAGVLEAAIEAMRALGAKDLAAAAGPAISAVSYEVGDDFRREVEATDASAADWFSEQGGLRFDLPGYVEARLARAGVAVVGRLDRCTCLEEDWFFSHRRQRHRSEKDYGRQLSAILLA